MADLRAVCIGRLLKKDHESGLCALQVRGVFRSALDAMGVVTAFGCDAIAPVESSYPVQIGEVVITKMEHVRSIS